MDKSLPDYVPKRFGLKFDPATIVIEYMVPSTGKLYHHKMRIRNLTASSNPEELLESLKRRHVMYLSTSKIQDDQIIELIRKLKENLCPEVDYNVFDLNKLTPEEVKEHKEKMDLLFRKNSKQPDDKDFVYSTLL